MPTRQPDPTLQPKATRTRTSSASGTAYGCCRHEPLSRRFALDR